MWLTLKTLFSKPATVIYPVEKEIPVPRARGVIALDTDACTVCMLCARECPDWCIYIEGHKEAAASGRAGRPGPRPLGARPLRHRLRPVHVLRHLRRGLPLRRPVLVAGVRVLRRDLADLLHDKGRLSQWLGTVPEPPALEGSES